MYLDELNKEQREAVVYDKGPLLILAGAGSGKTRTIIYRVAHLIKQGVSPYEILVMTFTNKAANEMKERIRGILDLKFPGMWIGTFHSICLRILQQESQHIGYMNPFTIYSQANQKTVIKQCIKDLNLDQNKYKVKTFLSAISSAKNDLETYQKFLDSDKPFDNTIGEVYRLYQKKLKQNNAMDFGDLIMNTVKLFKENKNILERYQEKFKHILIDEYQDTNRAQYVLVNLLTQRNRNICVVGDDDQSIYGWRGADLNNILDFENDFQDVKIIRLEQNYRSTSNILNAANSVIDNNCYRKAKELWTDKGQGEKVHYYQANDEEEEAYFVLKMIKELNITKDYEWKDVAILYRTHAQSRPIEDAFIYHNIPYKIYGGVRFYDRKEIQDILAYANIVVNPHDNTRLQRIINVPRRGIGDRTFERLSNYADEHNLSLYQASEKTEDIETLSSTYKNKINHFRDLIEGLRDYEEKNPVHEVISEIAIKSGYEADLAELKKKNNVEAETRLENISELINVAKQFSDLNPDGGLKEFLNSIALETDVDSYEEEEDSVTLMTLHSAKGLEFKVVFIVGLEEGLFPSNKFNDNAEEDLEEERRLCYVGMTRAQEELYLSFARSRRQYGEMNYNTPSRFLKEIPEEYIEVLNEDDQTESGRIKEYNTIIESDNPYNIGDKVEHEKLGIGIVLEVDENLIKVDFLQSGTRKLATEFAPLRLIKNDEITDSMRNIAPGKKLRELDNVNGDNVLNIGDIVEHNHFGVGEVLNLEGEFITIDFKKVGKKMLSIEFVELRKV
ncbi:MAG: ATP-dependent helicase [Clostridia bacterium]